ncbi:MAG: imidazole glycerol phosphate synthase subunit HisH [Firmicutes bacterium]|nr:imidazole glycerol phosphate synthase subunit HisH [Bacillota bacterium]
MIGVIDYKAGNAPSVFNALKRVGSDGVMVRSGEDLNGLSGIILPGVGSAEATLESLKETGILAALEKKVLEDKIPFLGICIGMQILFEHSEEGDVDCLGWLKGQVVRFDSGHVRVPQMGWNEVVFKREHPLVNGLNGSGHFYYVNSYHVVPECNEDVLAVTDYDGEFCCMVQHENIMAAQFHIEKSGPLGLAMLKNFVDYAEGGAESC